MSQGGINYLLTQVSGRPKTPMAAFSWIRAATGMNEKINRQSQVIFLFC